MKNKGINKALKQKIKESKIPKKPTTYIFKPS